MNLLSLLTNPAFYYIIGTIIVLSFLLILYKNEVISDLKEDLNDMTKKYDQSTFELKRKSEFSEKTEEYLKIKIRKLTTELNKINSQKNLELLSCEEKNTRICEIRSRLKSMPDIFIPGSEKINTTNNLAVVLVDELHELIGLDKNNPVASIRNLIHSSSGLNQCPVADENQLIIFTDENPEPRVLTGSDVVSVDEGMPAESVYMYR